MGLFDIFASKGPGAIKKHAARAANRRAQNPDRWESIQALAEMRTPEAVTALLARFTIRVDPSIVDQEEKDAAFQGVVGAGDVAVEPVKRFMRDSETISWPLKALEQLLPDEEVVAALLEALEDMDTEYERDPQKKIQLVAYLEDRADSRIVEAVRRFLDDQNETVRFHAIGAIYVQAEAETAREELLATLLREESVRCRARILDGFVENEWAVPDDQRQHVRSQLPDGYAIDGGGVPRK